MKSLKEVTYHVRWSSEWVIRLGDGTEESNRRIRKAMDELWQYTDELFIPAEYETSLANAGIGVDLSKLREPWTNKLKSVFEEAQLNWPATAGLSLQGKTGQHSPHLGDLLSEMQYMQRTYPGMEW
jgi:ring-1,2-phenylacetyl-CoA epoxidase subunit PaaC